ncbi:MAG: hypothetical protein MKZ63_07100, partial [Nitrospinales bacterium]|nr:hypothetical protein [Nitrospinales bacterium]
MIENKRRVPDRRLRCITLGLLLTLACRTIHPIYRLVTRITKFTTWITLPSNFGRRASATRHTAATAA